MAGMIPDFVSPVGPAAAGGRAGRTMRLGDSGNDGGSIGSTFENDAETSIKPRGRTPRRVSCKEQYMREYPSSLGPDELGQLARVTHLNMRELKTVDNLFNLLVEIAMAIGEPVHSRQGTPNTPRRSSKNVAAPTMNTETYALNIKQLRRLPEFGQNVFLSRFVRIFSDTGEMNLTLLELIDMYSALSKRCSFDWKAWIMFCVFDYDEDGMLDSGDIYRSIRQMIVLTHSLRVSDTRRGEAATLIQKHFRGRMTRKELACVRMQDGRPPIRQLGRSPTFTEAYVKKVLGRCNGVQLGVMDFRYFE